jgi:hypothetical protein
MLGNSVAHAGQMTLTCREKERHWFENAFRRNSQFLESFFGRVLLIHCICRSTVCHTAALRNFGNIGAKVIRTVPGTKTVVLVFCLGSWIFHEIPLLSVKVGRMTNDCASGNIWQHVRNRYTM